MKIRKWCRAHRRWHSQHEAYHCYFLQKSSGKENLCPSYEKGRDCPNRWKYELAEKQSTTRMNLP